MKKSFLGTIVGGASLFAKLALVLFVFLFHPIVIGLGIIHISLEYIYASFKKTIIAPFFSIIVSCVLLFTKLVLVLFVFLFHPIVIGLGIIHINFEYSFANFKKKLFNRENAVVAS